VSTSTAITVPETRVAGWFSRIADYAELAKLRILTMVLIAVTLSSLVATAGQPDVLRLLHTLVGVALVAASASAFNQCWEKSSDARMPRTAGRPLPAGRLSTAEAVILASAFVVGGLLYLFVTCGPFVAFWAGITWLLYVGVYTPLKPRTWLNTVVGAFPGALPIVVGWTGVGAPMDMRTAFLFGLVYFWQFPHFMAIAWLYRRQYAAAQLKMLPVVDPSGRRTGWLAVSAALIVAGISLLPAIQLANASWLYVVSTGVLGCGQITCAFRFCARRDDVSARHLLRASLVYLPLQLTLITLLYLALI
jgi:protoheme IX farnesyltransferase